MVTICPVYDGSVKSSWYPVRFVVKTTSPVVLEKERRVVPGNHAPSSSSTYAGFSWDLAWTVREPGWMALEPSALRVRRSRATEQPAPAPGFAPREPNVAGFPWH